MSNRILVGVSGGIDSAATVLMLQSEGYEVEGLYIDMLGCDSSVVAVESLSQQLGIKLHIARAKDSFERLVISKVLDLHRSGGTPSPCTICNPLLKWELLREWANKLSIHYLATGHYVQIEKIDSLYYIKQGVDPIKDQSYYLSTMGQDILSRAITPLGKWTKLEVREYLNKAGFTLLATGGESQGVCFAKCGYGEFLTKNLSPKPGAVLDCEGNTIGEHRGYPLYTIGQKRGFSLFDDEKNSQKLEVRSIHPPTNEIVVGNPLLTHEIILKEAWFTPPQGYNPSDLRVKIRGLGKNPNCEIKIETQANNYLKITLLSPTETFWAPAAEQPAVIYLNSLVVGNGTFL